MKSQGPTDLKIQTCSSEQSGRQAACRSHCYGLLALVFRGPPSPQVVEQLRSPELASALSGDGFDLAEALAGELEVVTDRLAQQYTRTFIGPGPHVSPYGSVHHDDEGQLWGDSTVRVKRFIEAIGLSLENDWDGIPDHIAIELELMQRLTDHEAELWARRAAATERDKDDVNKRLHQCLEAEQEFIVGYLSVWVSRFADHVSSRSTSRFYREMAKLTKSIVLADMERVGHVTSRFEVGLYEAMGFAQAIVVRER